MIHFLPKNSATRIYFDKFVTNFKSNNIFLPTSENIYVFLCGANKKDSNELSARRKALIDFSTKNLPNVRFFVAEKIFQTIEKHETSGNLLDIENEISHLSDFIIIILESESAFCELGSFAHKTLRKKLIVINDDAYRMSHSYINLGPIKAIEETGNKDHILYYKMEGNGTQFLDGIGSLFYKIKTLINKQPLKRRKRADAKEFNIAKYFSKKTVFFLHDIIYFFGPISRLEIIQLYIHFYGQDDYKNITRNLGLLVATEDLGISEIFGTKYYFSIKFETYFNYPSLDIDSLVCTFRNFRLKQGQI